MFGNYDNYNFRCLEAFHKLRLYICKTYCDLYQEEFYFKFKKLSSDELKEKLVNELEEHANLIEKALYEIKNSDIIFIKLNHIKEYANNYYTKKIDIIKYANKNFWRYLIYKNMTETKVSKEEVIEKIKVMLANRKGQ